MRGSGEAAKRGFLEKKGLTAAEIDEAFKRVPPEAPSAPAAAVATSSTPTVGANNLVTYTQQPQQAMQVPQHGLQGPSQALVPAQQMHMMQPQRPPMHWSQVSGLVFEMAQANRPCLVAQACMAVTTSFECSSACHKQPTPAEQGGFGKGRYRTTAFKLLTVHTMCHIEC